MTSHKERLRRWIVWLLVPFAIVWIIAEAWVELEKEQLERRLEHWRAVREQLTLEDFS